MADVTVKVLEPATSHALLSLHEAKIMLGIPTADTSTDAQLQLLIDINSAVIAAKCARVFAREKVAEYWRELQPPRLFLTHWPVKESDIESVAAPDGTLLLPTSYQLEESSGKILFKGGAPAEPIVITYTGGYELPNEAPMALKQAVGLLTGASRAEQQTAATAGIRMIAHKEARIMFHPPSSGSSSSSGGGMSGARVAVDSLCAHFTRFWI